jgi:hypothetical protein
MKTITRYSIFAVLLTGFSFLLAGCGGGGSGSSGTSGGSGTLSLQVTDGPVYMADHVYIGFLGLELQPSTGGRITLYYCEDPMDATKTIVSDTACTTPPVTKQLDLLALNGGLTDVLLDSYTLPAGHYNWIRLMIDSDPSYTYLVDATGDHELTIPSDAETGLKMNRGFDVAAGGHADFTVDFDLPKSIHVTGTGEYMMRPTLRLVDSIETGSIAGTVSSSLITATVDCTPAVYVFAGQNVTPDDIDGIAPDPVTTAKVEMDNMGVFRYKAAFLEPGTYTVAFTCQAAQDDPTTDDAISFSGAANVTVSAQTVTTYDF